MIKIINGKQRAWLRKEAHAIEPIFQIGKEGITQNTIKAIDEALEKRELVKIKILETAFLDTKPTCNDIAAELGAEPVQAIGNKFVLYRRAENEKNRKLELPKK